MEELRLTVACRLQSCWGPGALFVHSSPGCLGTGVDGRGSSKVWCAGFEVVGILVSLVLRTVDCCLEGGVDGRVLVACGVLASRSVQSDRNARQPVHREDVSSARQLVTVLMAVCYVCTSLSLCRPQTLTNLRLQLKLYQLDGVEVRVPTRPRHMLRGAIFGGPCFSNWHSFTDREFCGAAFKVAR